jgi:biopolymer transport protein ExbD
VWALALVACDSSTPALSSSTSTSSPAAASPPATASAPAVAAAPAAAPPGSGDTEDIVITVSKSEIRVGDETVVALPTEPTNDLMIEPLAAELRAIHAARKRAESDGGLPWSVIRADPTTPYRMLIRVLYTLSQSGGGAFALAKLDEVTGAGGKAVVAAPPTAADTVEPPVGDSRPSTPVADGGAPRASLHLLISKGGFTLLVDDVALAPGCASRAADKATMTVPSKSGEQDTAGLQRCAEKIKAETRDSTEVVIAAEAATPYREVLDAMAALRGPDGERFSDVRFGFRRGW